MEFWPIVLAGGAGTRFWPASRQAMPKPFVSLVGEDTLIGATLERLGQIPGAAPTSIVTSEDLGRVTRRAIRAFKGTKLHLEPEARNTAPAIAWAAACALGEGCAGVVGIFPADAHIPNTGAFVRTIRTAARAAADGEKLVLIGIEPTHPDIAYGYVHIGKGTRGAVPVKRFREKPKPKRAQEFYDSGEYVWNAGMVIARPERILSETREHSPEVWKAMGAVLEKIAAGKKVPRETLARAYRRAEKISFDYAVLERSQRAYAVRARFRWSDLGSWDALGEHLPAVGGNRCRGEAPLALDSTGNIVWNSTDKAVVLLDVEGLVIVDTPDALLICRKEKAQEVRRVVAELSRRGRKDLA